MISVIVPVYNTEKVLRYCLDSILKQTYKDFELILVDDGSTDKSGKICDEYEQIDKRVKTIHQKNSGVSAARNAGIENSNGDYICFVDSDDYVEDSFLKELTDLKTANPLCDNIWCGFCTTEEYGSYDINRQAVFEADKNVSSTDRRQIMDLHKKWLDTCTYCKLYSKRIINENKIRFSKEFSLGEDLIFNLEYLDKTDGSILIINKPLYLYITDTSNSLSKKFHEDLCSKYRVINSELFNYISKWGCDKKQFDIYYEACFYIYDNVLRNTFKPGSTIKRKYRYNREILRTKEFKETMKKGDFYINPVMRFILEHNLSFLYKILFIK